MSDIDNGINTIQDIEEPTELNEFDGAGDTSDGGGSDDSIITISDQVYDGIVPTDITTQMKSSYLDYAMSVIVSRALPDVRDGLKPVHRRIIYAMQDQNMHAAGKFHKSAAVVGEVLKKYHPHGDTAVYDTMVRMGQSFKLRYPLIIPQGNFGTIDGDSAAAMRYTEAKLAKITEEMYRDIDKETVPFEINDLQNLEPLVLPSVLPTLLINGSGGIAVGMATNIPPHNLTEVIDALNVLIEKATELGKRPTEEDAVKIVKPDFSSDATVEDLTHFVKGPDFPTGGTIYDHNELVQIYATGKGRAITRAKIETEETKNGRIRLIVTEIPYQVVKSTLVEKIAEMVKIKKIDGISDIRDESNWEGMRIVIELKKDATPKKVENRLYKYTPLQNTFNTNMLALVNGEPKVLTLKAILEEFVKHRQLVIINRTIFLLKKDKDREHILLGLKIALDNIDEVISIIRSSKDADTAKLALIKRFEFSELQAQAILDMQLRKLAALERKKLEDELAEVRSRIADYEDLLMSPERIIKTVKDELLEVKSKYGDERKTKVVNGKVGEISEEDLVKKEACIITMSKSGYVKRMLPDTYKRQGRGGKGVMGQTLKDEDEISIIKTCNTHDYGFFFTNTGRVYKLRLWEVPESSRQAKGTALINFLSIAQNESIEAFLTLPAETVEGGKGYIFFGTKLGVVKRTSLEDFANIRSSGIIAISLGDNDSLVWATFTDGKGEVMLTTLKGQSIRFKESDVRPMGRSAGGVCGVKLAKAGDGVVGMVILDDTNNKGMLLTVTEGGYGKKTHLDEYKIQKRSGSGIRTYKLGQKTGNLISAKVITQDDDMLIASQSGKIIRVPSVQVPELGRDTMGVRLISLGSNDKVTSVAFIGEEIESLEQE